MVMSRPLNLRKHHLLPDEAKKIAKIVQENQPIKRKELEKQVEKTKSLEKEDVRENVRILRMSENLVIEDEKVKILSTWCKGVNTSVMSKFRRWEREAKNS